MRSQNIRLLREISYYKSMPHTRLHLFNMMVKHNLNHTTIRAFTNTLYSCPKRSAWYGIKGLNSTEPHDCCSKMKYCKFKDIRFINLTTNSFRLNCHRYLSISQLKDFNNGKFDEDNDVNCFKGQNNLASEQFIKPVQPSNDDIQVKNYDIKCEDRYAISISFNINSILSNISNIITASTSNANLKTLSVHEDILTDKVFSNINKKSLGSPYVLYCSPSNANVTQSDGHQPKNLGKPSEEQLSKAYNALSNGLPNLFKKGLDFKIYSQDIVFENRIKGTRTVGLYYYIKQASLLRLVGHIKYAFVTFEILKITQHAEDSTIRVRWRIIGVSALQSLPMIFTLKSYSMKNAKEKMDDWYDGFSIFHVGADGLIYKHTADKMMPDEESSLVKKPSLASKLAALIGMAPKAPAAAAATSAAPPAVTSSRVNDLKDKSPNFDPNKTLVLTMVLNENVGSLM